MDDQTLLDLFDSLTREICGLRQEVKTGFEAVNQHLARIDATMVVQGRQIGAGARSIASFNEWVGKADADYIRLLSEISDLKRRVAKLENPEPPQ